MSETGVIGSFRNFRTVNELPFVETISENVSWTREPSGSAASTSGVVSDICRSAFWATLRTKRFSSSPAKAMFVGMLP